MVEDEPDALFCVLVDEVEQLVLDRNDLRVPGKSDLLSVLLSITDGAKEASNLKFICTTNLVERIDPAMLKRFEIQRFLGNPNRFSRLQWLECKLEEFSRKQLKDPLDEELPKFILCIEDIQQRKQLFADLVDYLDQNANQKDEVKASGLLIELNERGIPIENID